MKSRKKLLIKIFVYNVALYIMNYSKDIKGTVEKYQHINNWPNKSMQS